MHIMPCMHYGCMHIKGYLTLTDQSISCESSSVEPEIHVEELRYVESDFPHTTCLLMSSYIGGSGILEEYGCTNVIGWPVNNNYY